MKKEHDPYQMFWIGESFLRIADTYAFQFKANTATLFDLSSLFSNLAFSVEMMLKSCCVESRGSFGKYSHELDKLYLRLNQSDKTDVERRYEILQSEWLDRKSGTEIPRSELTFPLAVVLRKSANAFVQYRYMHELKELSELPATWLRFALLAIRRTIIARCPDFAVANKIFSKEKVGDPSDRIDLVDYPSVIRVNGKLCCLSVRDSVVESLKETAVSVAKERELAGEVPTSLVFTPTQKLRPIPREPLEDSDY